MEIQYDDYTEKYEDVTDRVKPLFGNTILKAYALESVVINDGLPTAHLSLHVEERIIGVNHNQKLILELANGKRICIDGGEGVDIRVI